MRSSFTYVSSIAILTLGLINLTGCVSKSAYLKEQSRANDLDAQLAQAKKSNADLADKLNITQDSAARLAQENSAQEELAASLQKQIHSDQVKISEIAGKVSINMVDKVLFDSGSAKLKPAGEAILMKVGNALKDVKDKRIWVGGHTDNIAISPSLQDKFASNWELSSARATAVVRYMEDKTAIPGDRLLAVGLGQNQPVGDNKTPEGRAANRRIEILLIPTPETLKSIKS